MSKRTDGASVRVHRLTLMMTGERGKDMFEDLRFYKDHATGQYTLMVIWRFDHKNGRIKVTPTANRIEWDAYNANNDEVEEAIIKSIRFYEEWKDRHNLK